jgi:chaperonin GroEL
MEIEGGYLSPYFVTDHAHSEARLDNPYFLLVRDRLTSMHSLLGVLEAVAKSGRSLLVIADDVAGEALATLVINKTRGTLRSCAVRITGSQAGSDAMDDLAAITGATVVAEEGDVPSLSLKDMGGAASVIVTVDRATIIGGALLN